MNAAVTTCVASPSAGTPRHVLTQDMGSVATSAPCLAPSADAGSRGAPVEGSSLLIAAEQAGDVAAREALLDQAMGPGRKRKSSEKLRRGRRPSEGLALVAKDADGALLGTVRLWDVRLGDGRGSLLLGPLAIRPDAKSLGIGSALMQRAIEEASRLGHRSILLVGDAPYYSRFGFSAEKTGDLAMPGPYERHRFLALELVAGSLDGARGVLRPSGRKLTANRTSLAA